MTTSIRTIGIIGGGPGGLALAQGLRKHGFAVRVFEKDNARTDYVQGFRLRVRERGLDALRLLLPESLYRAVIETAGRAPVSSRVFDEAFRPLPVADPSPEDDTHLEKSVSRVTLRQILLDGLADVLTTGKVYESYRLEEAGGVTARFADGTEETFDLLVGADGARSRVRGQLLPDAHIVDTGARRLAGKIPLAVAERSLDPVFLDHNVTIRPGSGPSLMVTSHRLPPDSLRRHDGIGGNDPSHAAIPGGHFDNRASYIWWNIAFPSGHLAPDEVLFADDGLGLVGRLIRQLGDWDPRILEVFWRTDPTTVGVLKVQSSVPPGTWTTGPVTLLGDALHAMTYFRALGANSAIYDAGRLVEALLAHRDGLPGDVAIARYEAAARDHGYSAVEESLLAMRRSIGLSLEAAA